MLMIALVALPFAGALIVQLCKRGGATAAFAIAAATALAALGVLAMAWPGIEDGTVFKWRHDWLASISLNLTLRLDGLAFTFAVLIAGIGLLVVIYARYYLPRVASTVRFFTLLLLFMGAMLGVVLSGNLLLMLVFWEMTSIVSFLLIGFWSYRSDARKGARMALTVTGAGGLALLAGVLLLGRICGSLELADVLAQGGMVQRHPLYPLMLVLVLIGAFTKSAQFPFFFWLPHAMSAPTPVSAYLHSATMVKAGVFLLARLYPVLDGTPWWFYIVSLCGLVTLLGGAAMALLQRDLKGLLAYSTISHLGLITLLFGLDTELSTVAALFHIINHAVFKASLFMAAGIIDHETGTRDLTKLRGLWRYMPHTGALAIVASLSMAGVPLLNGFLSKEMFFGETLAQDLFGYFNWIVPAAATLAGALSVAYSLRFIYGVFFDGKPDDLPNYPPHEPPRLMKVPVEILVVICLVVGLVPNITVGALLQITAYATLGKAPPEYSLSPWHGFNVPLMMSLISLVAGTLLFYFRREAFHRHHATLALLNARDRFEDLMQALGWAARTLTAALENGSLQRYIALLVAVMVLLPGWYLLGAGTMPLPDAMRALSGPLPQAPLDPITGAGLAIMALGAIVVVACRRQRVAALSMLSMCGLLMALLFARFSAPDLALTQVSVEVVTILLLVLALYFLPGDGDKARQPSRPARWLRDGVLALAGGAFVSAAAFAVMTRPYDSIGDYFVRNSVSGGGGHNIVNVILVDFRGFDTFGEICVLLVAGLGVQAMLKGLRLTAPAFDPNGAPWAGQSHPLLLSILARLMLPLTVLVAVFILLRGHNLPGGGFVAALVTSIALLMQYVASGVLWTESRIGVNYRVMAGAGIVVAGLTGLGSWFFGYPFLTTSFGHFHIPLIGEIELATAMIFDVGVYMTVVGTTLLIVSHLGVRDKRILASTHEQAHASAQTKGGR